MLQKRNPPIGARPGTLAIPTDSPPPRVFLFDYSPKGFVERPIEDVAELERYTGPETTTWVDVRGLGDEAMLRRIAETFGVHPLALEDAVNVPQRAKTELYDRHQLVIARAPLVHKDILEVPQVCLLIGPRYLLSFQDRSFGFFDPVRERIRAGIGPIREEGPDYLAYALVDTLIDLYYPVVEDLSAALDDLEDLVLGDPAPEELARLHRLRRHIAVLRRVGWPQLETVSDMLRSESPFISESVRVYLRDTHDHITQVMGRVDFCREVAVGLMDIYLSNIAHRQNEIMKVLTLMASIFIPLTFIAGIYGMNFEYMPELSRRGGYFAVLGVMATVALGMIWYFRRRGWLYAAGRELRRSDGDSD